MARKCELTGKKTTAGKSIRHKRGSSGGSGTWARKAQSTNRTFRPNLVRKVRVLVNGRPERMTLSTKALKRIRNFGSFKGVTLPEAK